MRAAIASPPRREAAEPSATLLIDGEWHAATSEFEVIDPATLEPIGHAAEASPADALRALDAAVAVAEEWAAVPPEQRAERLRAAAARLRTGSEDLAARLTAENGKPLREARAEILGSARMLEWSAEEGRRAYGRVMPAGGSPGFVLREPVGPTLAISPWNFPASMLVRKIGLALAAGAPVIAKPAEQTPLIGAAVVRIINEAGLPAGALQLLTTSDPAATVAPLLADPRLRKLSFTGSSEVGLALVRQTGSHLRRISLEMGGHAPALVFEDADVTAAADAIVQAKFSNAGQSCTAINRLYVDARVHEDLLSALLARVERLRPGHGAHPDTDLGPLIDEAGFEKAERHVVDACDHGARLMLGGRRWSPGDRSLKGSFYEPTLLAGVDERMAITREETFGPVLPVSSFDDDDDPVRLANATEYGLAAYVFASDFRRIWDTVQRLRFGIVGVNEPTPVRPELPFGGVKNSGQEREGGTEGIDAYLDTKSVAIRT